MPREECSRCGGEVAASSLFCAQCGQSMLRPLVRPEPDESAPEASPDEVSAPDDHPVSATKDTLSRAADWLKRLGRPRETEEIPRQSPTIGQSVQAARQAAQESLDPDVPGVGDTMALPLFSPDSPADADADTYTGTVATIGSSRGHRRFVLKVEDGRQFTLGEVPGGMGSAPESGGPTEGPTGGPWQWIYVDGEESVDPVHLHFGSENGVLWVSDQGSVFGTVVAEPGRTPLQCIPGDRYFVIRGSEIRLGGLRMTLQ
jgi:hypothetical protein